MSRLDNLFSKLKTKIVGTKTADIDLKLDSSLKDIINYRTPSSQSNYIEIIKGIISKSNIGVDSFVSQSSMGYSPELLGQTSRLSRYKTYDAITSNISYCYRALQVLTDNVLAPDDITKDALEIKSYDSDKGNEKITNHINIVKNLVEKTKIEKNLSFIIKTSLHMGDFFCEISDDKNALLSKSTFLAESKEEFQERIKDRFSKFEVPLINEDEKNIENKNLNVVMDFTPFTEGEDTSEEGESIEKIKLIFHEPKRVVKLQSTLFPICFGYLIFPQALFQPQLLVQNQIVDNICQNIMKNLESKIPNIDSENINISDIKNILKQMVLEGDQSKVLNIRYVPPDKIQHFKIPSTKYHPYGESIFDSCQFNAKLLMALETALTIHRINRSIQKRKITVEIGLPRDAKEATEKLKEEFKKRKFSLDSFGSVDTIPSMITSFEDIYLPQKDGKQFVDVTPFDDAGSESRNKVDELKFIRDSIVASLMVPPSYLALEENLSNKSALSEESIIFARTIINYQKYFTEQIRDLIYKILVIINPKEADSIMDVVLITLPIPKSLQYERETKLTNDSISLIQSLEQIGVPKDWAKRRYLSNIDWDEIEKNQTENKMEKTLNIDSDSNIDQFGGIGGSIPGY